jgi:lycopene beta-cyclase
MFMSLLIKRIHMRPSFNSIYNKAVNTNQFPVLQQHFIGWFIKSDSRFNPARATFSWLRKRKHSFYVRAAYISHRSFTRIHLVFAWSFGESRINGNKRIVQQPLHNRKEQGSIPWLVTRSGKKYTKVLNIGTQALDKGKYRDTFKNSDKYSTQLVQFLEQGRNLKNFIIKLNFALWLAATRHSWPKN